MMNHEGSPLTAPAEVKSHEAVSPYCLNGEIFKSSDMEILFRSEGLQFGFGLFETIRIHQQEPMDFEAHLHRLRQSCLELAIELPTALRPENKTALLKTLNPILSDENPGVLRIQVVKVGTSSQWWAVRRPQVYDAPQYERGFQLGLSDVKRHSSSLLIRHKTTNYGELYLQRQKALQRGQSDVVMMNEHDHVTETSIGNLFYLQEGLWYTPPLEDGLLPGIMRQKLMTVLADLGLWGAERSVNFETLILADRVYLTNSLFGLMPVTSLETTVFGRSFEEHQSLMKQIGF